MTQPHTLQHEISTLYIYIYIYIYIELNDLNKNDITFVCVSLMNHFNHHKNLKSSIVWSFNF